MPCFDFKEPYLMSRAVWTMSRWLFRMESTSCRRMVSPGSPPTGWGGGTCPAGATCPPVIMFSFNAIYLIKDKTKMTGEGYTGVNDYDEKLIWYSSQTHPFLSGQLTPGQGSVLVDQWFHPSSYEAVLWPHESESKTSLILIWNSYGENNCK